MGYSAIVVNKVRDMFASRRQAAVDLAAEHLEEVYFKCPGLADIDRALSMTGLNLFRAASGPKEGLEERFELVKKENFELQNARKTALAAAGFPEDYTNIKYACDKCQDTGYVGIDMCECYKKALVTESYATSGLGKYLKEQTFRNFDLTYYSDEKIGSSLSEREMMASVLEKAKKFVTDFGKEGKESNLLFLGTTGLGKTHITTAIAKGVIEKGCYVVYDNAQSIMRAFEMQRFERNEEAAASVNRYFECDLLIIDDLGTEFRNSFTDSAFYELVNTRINSGKSMIISTNLDSVDKLIEAYDQRITSRLLGNFRAFRFVGKDIRIQRAKRTSKK